VLVLTLNIPKDIANCMIRNKDNMMT